MYTLQCVLGFRRVKYVILCTAARMFFSFLTNDLLQTYTTIHSIEAPDKYVAPYTIRSCRTGLELCCANTGALDGSPPTIP